MTGTTLIDLGAVPDAHCDHCLDELFKAFAIDPKADAERSMWRLHENPWLTRHVEDVTARLQHVLRALQDALARALTGAPIGELAKAEPWLRWDGPAFAEARLRLEEKPPSRYTLDDWLLLVDFLIQTYLPDGVIQEMADYLSVRATMMGQIQAAMGTRQLDAPTLSSLSELVPTSFARVPMRELTPVEIQVLRIAKARAAMHISDVTEQTRGRMKTIIIEHVQAMMLGQKEGTSERLRSRLFDSFGTLNRDFRRIAVTESGEAMNTGFIAAQRPGQKVRRREAYEGACDWCRSINNKVFTVVDPAKEPKDGEREVWVGKTNVGRSASPRKRLHGELVEREPEERWWCAAGAQHPHCRGSWLPVSEPDPRVRPEFTSWLNDLIAQASPAAREARAADAQGS